MNEIQGLLDSARKQAKVDLQALQRRAHEMSYGTRKATPADITKMVTEIHKRYPPKLWVVLKTGELMLDSSMMTVIREDPTVINGKKVWADIDRALKGGRG